MAQAGGTEKYHWKLLREDGENIAEGKEVIIGEKTYHIGWLGSECRGKLHKNY